MVNTFEGFHIHSETKLDNQINDKCTIKYNVIFDTIIQRNTSRGHSPLKCHVPALALFPDIK